MQNLVVLFLHEVSKDNVNVIVAGANDVYCNEPENGIKALHDLLHHSKKNHIIVANITHRYEQINNSIVNVKIRKINNTIKHLCAQFAKVSLIDIGKMSTDCHTRHAMHLNGKGRKQLINKLLEAICKIENTSRKIALDLEALDVQVGSRSP